MSFNSSGGFRSVQPFSGAAGFYGGVDLQRGRDSDTYLDNPFTRHAAEERKHGSTSDNCSNNKFYKGFHDGLDMNHGHDSDDAFNNVFTRHAAEQKKQRYISENSSVNKFYKGFGDDTIAKRQCSDTGAANRLRGCPETNRMLLDEYGRDGQFRSPPQFFANIPLQAVQRRSQGLNDADLPDFETLSLTPRDRFYSARAAHRTR